MKYSIQTLMREYFEGILAAILFAIFLRFFVFSVLFVPTNSMSPGLIKGDFVIGSRLSYGFPVPLSKGQRWNGKPPQRGDLVSLRFPGDEEQVLIRRVVAVGGDQVEINKGVVTVNGEKLQVESGSESQITERAHGTHAAYQTVVGVESDLPPYKIPQGQFFVLGDNRKRSNDSRDWGTVPVENLESKIFMIWLSLADQEQSLSIRWDRLFHWVH